MIDYLSTPSSGKSKRKARQAQAQMARSNNVHWVDRSVVREERDEANKAYKVCNFENVIKNCNAYRVKNYLIAQPLMQTCASVITI